MDREGALELGRDAYRRRAWRAAYEALARADRAAPLEAEDLWSLAMAAFLVGRDEDFVDLLDRAHRAYLEAGDTPSATRCAFWIGFRLASRGELGRATGWLARAERLLERIEHDCVEQGYLLLPVVERHLASGEHQAALEVAKRAAEIAERFADADLHAFALHAQGVALLRQARVAEGLARLDEAMVAVAAGELLPPITGIIYCSVISSCRSVYALRRAHEWTTALSRWCEEQPDMVAFAGQCLVHRAEILQLHGAWHEALEEANRAYQRGAQADDRQAAAAAFYQRGEVQRLLGEFAAAEEAYQQASLLGREPQPGLALLRLAQGEDEAAAASVRRLLAETSNPIRRARLLPACIEVLLAVEDLEGARIACHELEETAQHYEMGVLATIAAHARGATELAAGNAPAALTALRRAWHGWQALEAPYEAARARLLLGLACRELGDNDGAELELEAARKAFEDLGAAPDLARLHALRRTADDTHGLTPRELQVLRLVAAGHTNKAVARELGLSERTVERHVSNIFDKLGVASRAAATAYAYERRLV